MTSTKKHCVYNIGDSSDLIMALNQENERKLRRNWSLLKQEVQVDLFVMKFVDDGIFSPSMRGEIMNVIPNTASMKGKRCVHC